MMRCDVTLYTWLERQLFVLLPGYCPLCLGMPQKRLPWCKPCWQALPLNDAACSLCAEPITCRIRRRVCNEDLDSLGMHEPMLCQQCRDTPPMLHYCLAPYVYQREIARLMCRYKQHGDLLSGRLLFELVWYRIAGMSLFAGGKRVQALLAVPPDCKRTRNRGFDPVYVWAKRLSRLTGLPLLTASRKEGLAPQKTLNRRERRANMKDVFKLEGRVPERILILDDVATTGATLDSLAATCFVHGAEWVGALAFARTPTKRGNSC